MHQNHCLAYRPILSLQWEHIKVMTDDGSETSKLLEEFFVPLYKDTSVVFCLYFLLFA